MSVLCLLFSFYILPPCINHDTRALMANFINFSIVIEDTGFSFKNHVLSSLQAL